MGSSNSRQAVPVQEARQVIIDNSTTKALFGFHWRTFGLSYLGFAALAAVFVIIAAWCFRVQHRSEIIPGQREVWYNAIARAAP